MIYVVLVDKSKEDINLNLEIWRNTLPAKGFNLNKIKIEYLKYNFYNKTSAHERKIKMNDTKISTSKMFDI